jgi:serralysin
VIIEDADGGSDRVSTNLLTYVLPDNVERLDFTGPGANSGDGNVDANVMNGASGDNVMNGLAGADLLQGRAGDDTMSGGADNDRVIGNSGVDTLRGDGGNDLLVGRLGDDVLNGGADADLLVGGEGDDQLTGGLGLDRLLGNAGADSFIYTDITDSGPDRATQDRIFAFSSADGDRIDLSAIDAIASSGADDAFTFVAAFSGEAGQLIVQDNGATVIVAMDVTGNGAADAAIFVQVATLDAVDFIL